MGQYSDLGLDETKKSRDPGSIGKLYCIFCNTKVDFAFSMCFNEWAICECCSANATNIENNDRWELAESCFKCYDKDIIGYRTEPSLMALHICKGCIDWSKKTFNRRNEQLKNQNMSKALSETAIETLKKVTVEGMVVKLPTGFLDRKIYLEVNKALEGIGGKWTKGKNPGHYFKEDPQPHINKLLGVIDDGKIINYKKEFQFFATPAHLADTMVDMADIEPYDLVIEPSAGDGALIKAINRKLPEKSVMYFEAMPQNLKLLQAIDTAFFMGTDFLKLKASMQFSKILANPPFTKGQDVEHIQHMHKCLAYQGIMVTIASIGWMSAETGSGRKFRNWLDSENQLSSDKWRNMPNHDNNSVGFESKVGKVYVQMIPSGEFKESGTMVPTCLIKITKN